MNAIIEIKDVSYKYPNGSYALENVSLTIYSGEKIAIVGSNGAGKSTLLLMLNGILKPQSGEILFNGENISYKRSSLRELRKRVGFVFQNPDNQIIAPTVYQDVAFGPVNLGYDKDRVKTYVSHALGYTGLLGFERRPPHHLSGGEKKKVAMAGILAMEPDVFVFDEPTSALDPASSEDIMELLSELNGHGKTIIISTHDVELAYPWADRIVLMNKGKIISEGEPGEIFTNRADLKSASLSMPVLMDLYECLCERGLTFTGNPPRSVLEMVKKIETFNQGPIQRDEDMGKIYILNAESPAIDSLQELMKIYSAQSLGAMGTKAKICLKNKNLSPDFTYGVIDKCLLKAMNSGNSLIVTVPVMIKRIGERVRDFNSESGHNIEIIEIEDNCQTKAG
jgi:cobalt/nickel transport system ATP-binding protein